ncbi:MAG: protein kinase domain-containing protein [Gammaproteobacteria bacterium]
MRHDRPVALKVLHPELAASLGPDRFQREIRLAARLQHPHILTVLDSGETAARLWFTMPYVEGESLRDRLRRERQLPVEDALRARSSRPGIAGSTRAPTSTPSAPCSTRCWPGSRPSPGPPPRYSS